MGERNLAGDGLLGCRPSACIHSLILSSKWLHDTHGSELRSMPHSEAIRLGCRASLAQKDWSSWPSQGAVELARLLCWPDGELGPSEDLDSTHTHTFPYLLGPFLPSFLHEFLTDRRCLRDPRLVRTHGSFTYTRTFGCASQHGLRTKHASVTARHHCLLQVYSLFVCALFLLHPPPSPSCSPTTTWPASNFSFTLLFCCYAADLHPSTIAPFVGHLPHRGHGLCLRCSTLTTPSLPPRAGSRVTSVPTGLDSLPVSAPTRECTVVPPASSAIRPLEPLREDAHPTAYGAH